MKNPREREGILHNRLPTDQTDMLAHISGYPKAVATRKVAYFRGPQITRKVTSLHKKGMDFL